MFKTVDKIYQLSALLKELKNPNHKLNYPLLHERAWELFRENCSILEEELKEYKLEVEKDVQGS